MLPKYASEKPTSSYQMFWFVPTSQSSWYESIDEPPVSAGVYKRTQSTETCEKLVAALRVRDAGACGIVSTMAPSVLSGE